MPVHANHTSRQFGNSSCAVTRHASEKAAIRAALKNCDILLTWGVSGLSRRLADFDGTVVAISHGAAPWVADVLKENVPCRMRYVAVSGAAANAFPVGIRSQVKILPAGIELDRIAASRSRGAIRRDLGLCPDEKAVGYIGRFSAEKNPLQIARIVGQLGGRYVAVYHGANLWGDTEFRAEARRLSGNRICFINSKWHTGDVYAALDSLVQASPNEGGPLVAIEAWLCGVPLVTTPVGIVADELKRGNRWGHILPLAATLDDWCAAVSDACTERSGVEAQCLSKMAVERYSAAALARRWEAFLVELSR